MTETETPADRLREAAATVRQGHCRGHMIDRWGNRCAIGALTRVHIGDQETPLRRLLDDPIAFDASVALAGYLETAGVPACGCGRDLRVHTIAGWNDTIAADGEEVAATMEKAAAAYEERA